MQSLTINMLIKIGVMVMAVKFIEYKLHKYPEGMKTPYFVEEGGYFHNKEDHTIIGTVKEGAEYYIPDTLIYLTLEQLQERQLKIHAKEPMGTDNLAVCRLNPDEPAIMTDEQVNQAVADWVTARQSD